MATIAIDARFYGTEHTGLGRYTTNVMEHLPKALQGHTLKVLLRRKYYDSLVLPMNCEKILCEIPHYSLAEQVKLPLILSKLNIDLLYTFHFNSPIFVKIPTVITIHDLIKSYFTGSDTTTRTPWIYTLKRLGYNKVLKNTLARAQNIIVPTNTVKNQILANFPMVKPELIHPIPEAPDPIFYTKNIPSTNYRLPSTIPSDYLLYVGNAYPHKNLKVILDALRQLPKEHLVIVSRVTPFLSRTLAPYEPTRYTIVSGLTDQELVHVYRSAKALITPSLMEGYGLVGLEALMVGTPVIASDIPVYREVYKGNVTYFDPRSVPSLVSVLKASSTYHLRSKIKITRTWEDVAKKIAEVINESSFRLRSTQ